MHRMPKPQLRSCVMMKDSGPGDARRLWGGITNVKPCSNELVSGSEIALTDK